MALDPRDLLRKRPTEESEVAAYAPLAGTRAQRIQRLQIGLMGIGGMVLLLGLADAISSRAQLTEDNAVPEAAPTVVASETTAPRDPLADAGVLPELPATPSPTPTPGSSTPAGAAIAPAPPPNNAPLQ
ncbi:MAG: hypothetical protein KDE15_03975 [Erythrobacter sp.]|nr:hypothetical protein [Erythrobacter sp.]